jgi:hypothetical protein
MMEEHTEVQQFLIRHIRAIMENDLAAYHETTHEDLTLYEWFVTPHRIDGLAFHDFMMESNAERGTIFGSNIFPGDPEDVPTRFDLANLRIQCYENTAIASYTLLISKNLPINVEVLAHNESRVMVKINGKWKVVHCHKSPAWPAPHLAPGKRG